MFSLKQSFLFFFNPEEQHANENLDYGTPDPLPPRPPAEQRSRERTSWSPWFPACGVGDTGPSVTRGLKRKVTSDEGLPGQTRRPQTAAVPSGPGPSSPLALGQPLPRPLALSSPSPPLGGAESHVCALMAPDAVLLEVTGPGGQDARAGPLAGGRGQTHKHDGEERKASGLGVGDFGGKPTVRHSRARIWGKSSLPKAFSSQSMRQ